MKASRLCLPRCRVRTVRAIVFALWPLCQTADAQTAAPLKKELPSGQQAGPKAKAPMQDKKTVIGKPPTAGTAAAGKPLTPDKAQPAAIKPDLSTKTRTTIKPPVVAPHVIVDPPQAEAASQPQKTTAAAKAWWSLPARSVVKAAASAAATQPANRTTATPLTPAARGELTLSTLRRHGFRGADLVGMRQGLPSEILSDPIRSQLLLNDLRGLDGAGEWTTRARRLPPQDNEQQTESTLERLRVSGELVAVTGSEALADRARRKAATTQCRRATLELDRHELRIRGISVQDPSIVPGSAPFWSALEGADKPALDQYRTAADVYTRACLDTQWLSLTEEQRVAMRRVVGHVLLDGVRSCMGARVAAGRFLTARHCLYQYDKNLAQWQPRPVAQRHVALIGDAKTWFDATELDCAAPQPDSACGALTDNPVTSDQIVLKLAALSQDTPAVPLPPMPALNIERPALQQFLVVPGHSAWITGRAWGPGDEVYVTTAAVPGCMVAEIANGCVVNSCQSEAGFSGAPMFARRNVKQLVMVGIFLGVASAYEQCLRTDRNFGASPPSHILAGGK